MIKYDGKIIYEQVLLFSEYLNKFPLSLNLVEAIEKVYELKKDDPEGVRYSNEGNSWQSDPDKTEAHPYFHQLTKNINQLVSDFYQQPYESSRIHVNINPKHSYNSYHGHGNTPVIGVLYLQVPKNSGAFRIWDPLIAHVNKPIIPIEGHLYTLNGKLFHDVDINYNDKERISIAFNFDLI